MSSTSLSDHIPDLDLITFYAEKQETLFSRVSPWTKCVLLVFLVLSVTLIGNLLVLLVLYLVILGAYAAAHLPVRRLFAWYSLPVIFVLTLLLKALVVVTYSLFFLMTTRYQYFSAVISRVFPSPLDQIFLMAYRFLFLTLAMTGSILKAVRSRGGGIIHSTRMQGRLFAAVFAHIFLRSFERSERVHKAMLARGYSGSYGTAVEIPKPGAFEYVAVGIGAVFVIAAALMVSY